MGVHKQIRFRVEPGAVSEVRNLILDYAGYVADWVDEHGPEWRWTTYQQTEDPTRFVSVMWHEDEAAMERHRDAEGTRRFAEKLYRHVVDSSEIRFDRIADSEGE